MNEAIIIKKLNAELKGAKSMKEMFSVLEKYYDLENCRPGDITKAGIIMSLQSGVKMVGAKLKTQKTNGTTQKKGHTFSW